MLGHSQCKSFSCQSPGDARVPLPPLDPRVLRDLERDAKKVAGSLNYIMDNLHNSLHAVSQCVRVYVSVCVCVCVCACIDDGVCEAVSHAP